MTAMMDESLPPMASRQGGGPWGFLLTVFIGCMNNAPLMTARLILPLIAMQAGASPGFVGLIAAMFTALPIVFNVGFGRWVDRSGTLVPMVLASLLIGVASLLPILWGRPAMLLAMAGLIGCGTVFSHVATTRAVGEIGPPEQRTRNLGLLIAAYSVFQFVGPMVAGVTLEHYGKDWAVLSIGAFAVLALCGLMLPGHLFTCWTTLRDAAAARPRIRELVRVPSLMRWLAVSSVTSSVVTIFPFVVALHAAEIGMSASQAGLALGAFAIGTVVSRLLTGPISRHVRAHVAISAMLGVGAILYAALPAMAGFASFAALNAALGLVLGMSVPFVLSVIYSVAPPRRVNEAIGLSMTLTNVIQTLMPLGLGLLAARLGGAVMSWMLALLMLGAIGLSRKP